MKTLKMNQFPWSYYYLILSGIPSAITAGVWAGHTPLTTLSTLAWQVSLLRRYLCFSRCAMR
jgi:hypothetical protein